MKKKQMIALGLAAAMLAGGLSGCGNSSGEPAQNDVAGNASTRPLRQTLLQIPRKIRPHRIPHRMPQAATFIPVKRRLHRKKARL